MARRGSGIYRRGRLCILLVSLCALLAVAASASAECAWVMWANVLGSEGVQTWQLFAAYPHHDACMSNALWATALEEKKPRNPNVRVLFNCFPDTVDPRGPKGTK